MRHQVVVDNVDGLLADRKVQTNDQKTEFDFRQYHTLDEVRHFRELHKVILECTYLCSNDGNN